MNKKELKKLKKHIQNKYKLTKLNIYKELELVLHHLIKSKENNK